MILLLGLAGAAVIVALRSSSRTTRIRIYGAHGGNLRPTVPGAREQLTSEIHPRQSPTPEVRPLDDRKKKRRTRSTAYSL